MQIFKLTDKPIKVFGVPFFDKTNKLERLPSHLRESLTDSRMSFLGRRCPGARVCFRTNSKTITLKMVFETLKFDIALALYCCQSAEVFFGDRKNSRFAGLLVPSDYDTMVVEKTFTKKDDEEEVTIWLPRNEILADFTIAIEDGTTIEAPTQYENPLPILYYGSSITEGGNCCRITNAYSAIISRHLDVDFYNMGFSGCALGEPALANFIADIPMSVFVMDYDYNAPTPEHLEKTHKPFFDIIREKNPKLPIVLISRLNVGILEGSEKFREVVKATYESAKATGDKNVYYLDGASLIAGEDRVFYLNDNIHPNDMGFYKIAEGLEPLIKRLLQK